MTKAEKAGLIIIGAALGLTIGVLAAVAATLGDLTDPR